VFGVTLRVGLEAVPPTISVLSPAVTELMPAAFGALIVTMPVPEAGVIVTFDPALITFTDLAFGGDGKG
jgi:hypothetical protein